MRELILSDGPRHLRKDAMLRLKALACYPEDTASREQALLILAHEQSRWQTSNPGDYSVSHLTRAVLEDLGRRAAHRATAGFVAIALECLDIAGIRRSLETAAEIVSRFAGNVDKVPFVFWRDGQYVESTKPISDDVATIKAHFRAYRSVSHICAAEIVAADYLEPMPPFEENEVADACFLSTVLYYQHCLRRIPRATDWGMWQVRVSPPFDLRDFPPLMVSDSLLDELIGPWNDEIGFKLLEKAKAGAKSVE